MFDIDDFILAVKERPALYNPAHQFYNRKDVRAQLWAEVGTIMYPNWRELDFQNKTEKSSFLQKKWKSLKDCFNREIRQQKTEIPGRPRKKYEFYEQLSFLHSKNKPPAKKPKMSPKESKIKLETVQKAEENTPKRLNSASKLLEIKTPERNPRKRKCVQKEQEKPLKWELKKPEVTRDCDRLFLLSFVDDLKKLPLPSKYWVKMKFTEIMHQAAMSLVPESEGASVEYEDDYRDFEEENSADSSLTEVFVCHNGKDTGVIND